MIKRFFNLKICKLILFVLFNKKGYMRSPFNAFDKHDKFSFFLSNYLAYNRIKVL